MPTTLIRSTDVRPWPIYRCKASFGLTSAQGIRNKPVANAKSAPPVWQKTIQKSVARLASRGYESIFGSESAHAGTAGLRLIAPVRFCDRVPRRRLLRGRPVEVSDGQFSEGKPDRAPWRERS